MKGGDVNCLLVQVKTAQLLEQLSGKNKHLLI